MIGSYFLLSAVTVQIFNPIARLVISIGIPTNKAKAEMETHLVTAEIKIKKYHVYCKQ